MMYPLPDGYWVSLSEPRPGESLRRTVHDPDNEPIGDIIYVARDVEGGTEYGWLPDAPRQRRLRTQREAAEYWIDRQAVVDMVKA